MSYMEKKLQLVNSFGTKKSIKKVTSMLTNTVDEGGITNKEGKGVRDRRLMDMAEIIEGQQEDLKKEQMSNTERRKIMYSKEKLLPDKIIHDMSIQKDLSRFEGERCRSNKKSVQSPSNTRSTIDFLSSQIPEPCNLIQKKIRLKSLHLFGSFGHFLQTSQPY
jgi:hypothetical protein